VRRAVAPPVKVVRAEADAREAVVSLIARVLREEAAPADQLGYDECRTAETILKVRELDLKIRDRQKGLVPLARVRSHIEKAFTAYKQAMQRLPSRYAAAIAAESAGPHGREDIRPAPFAGGARRHSGTFDRWLELQHDMVTQYIRHRSCYAHCGLRSSTGLATHRASSSHDQGIVPAGSTGVHSLIRWRLPRPWPYTSAV
jgi:hypothetical protein